MLCYHHLTTYTDFKRPFVTPALSNTRLAPPNDLLILPIFRLTTYFLTTTLQSWSKLQEPLGTMRRYTAWSACGFMELQPQLVHDLAVTRCAKAFETIHVAFPQVSFNPFV